MKMENLRVKGENMVHGMQWKIGGDGGHEWVCNDT